MFKRAVDVSMTVVLMMLMSSQIIEGVHHELCGISMFVLFVIHQVLNRRWYASLFRGRYNMNRVFMTVINLALLISFILTVFSGIIMSESFPELNIEALSSFARLCHLCLNGNTFRASLGNDSRTNKIIMASTHSCYHCVLWSVCIHSGGHHQLYLSGKSVCIHRL